MKHPAAPPLLFACILLIALCLGLLPQLPRDIGIAAADIYRWTDADGVTHLSDAPPAAASHRPNAVTVRTYSEPQRETKGSPAPSPDEHRGEAVIPFTKNSGGIIVVDALINRSVPARLVVDTGASVITITEELARRLSHSALSSPEAVTIEGLGGTMQGRSILIPRLDVGNVGRDHVPAVVMSGGSGFRGPFDGLLGMNFLGEFELAVDYENNRIVLKEKNRSSR
jgi:clan AA aspartic protease (TIGR02281 family)